MHPRLLSAIVALVCALGLSGLATSQASAETMNYPKNPLTAVPDDSSGGAASRATPMGGTFACNLPFVTIQADASGFAVGVCPQGTHLRRMVKSDAYNGHTWDGGHIFGNYSGCGFIQSEFSNLAFDSNENLCPYGAYLPTDSYQAADNENTGPQNIPGGCAYKPDSAGNWRCTDGTVATLNQNCTLYGNVRPWLPNQWGTDPIRVIPAGQQVRWRYVSQYVRPDSSIYRWTMVRDMAQNTDGYGNWGFIAQECISDPYPGARWTG